MQQHLPAWACVLVMLAGEASAQEPRSPLVDAADSRMQIGAASLVPTLRRRWLYADHKLVVGRVKDVRVSADGTMLIAVVARRRWLGGGVSVTSVNQPVNEPRIAVKGEDDRPVRREQGIEILI